MNENNLENKEHSVQNNNSQKPIVSAILLAGVLIAGAILLKDATAPTTKNTNNGIAVTSLAPIGPEDRILGNPEAKVAVVMYEDFQCPFCGAIAGSQSSTPLIKSLQQRDPTWLPLIPALTNDYIKKGTVKFVYRDWAFLGPESFRSAEAARCAGDQGKFWEYHDYLYDHQNGENEGAFADNNLKSFAKTLNLNTSTFDQCLDDGKYMQAVLNSKQEGVTAGVAGTPKGFILRDGKIVSTIDGAEGYRTVKVKIENALK